MKYLMKVDVDYYSGTYGSAQEILTKHDKIRDSAIDKSNLELEDGTPIRPKTYIVNVIGNLILMNEDTFRGICKYKENNYD